MFLQSLKIELYIYILSNVIFNFSLPLKYKNENKWYYRYNIARKRISLRLHELGDYIFVLTVIPDNTKVKKVYS